MNFKKRLFISIGITSTLIIALGGAIGVLGSGIIKKTEQIQAINGETVRRGRTAEALAKARQELEVITPVRGAIDTVLLRRDQLLGLRNEIQEMARGKNVQAIVTISGETSRKGEGLTKTDFVISAQGSVGELEEFMNDLERGKYNIKITSFDMNEENNSAKISINGQVLSL